MPEDQQKTGPKPVRPLAFWDIESIVNIFMFAVYQENVKPPEGSPEAPYDQLLYFYKFDGMEMTPDLKALILETVFEKNKSLDPKTAHIMFLDLNDPQVNIMVANLFSADDKAAFAKPDDNRFRVIATPRNDIDGDVSFPYMIGYNTSNYDNTMMAFYFSESWGFSANGKASFMPVSAKEMRKFNNLLFDAFKERMPDALKPGPEKNLYDNTMRSGLYLDAGKINDKVYKMPLKRIMGMMGMDIFEDENVKGSKPITDPKEIAELFAYNASDCIKLARLFEHRAYKAQFELKKGLIDAYPDLIFNKDDEIRVNRMKIDDTSAKFAARVLCPDGFLPDIRAVSFEYPKGSGRNILKETREWAAEKFKDHPEILRDYLNPIFDWYGRIEGCNFDASEHYEQTYPLNGLPAQNIRDIPWPCTSVPYFNADGSFSRTYVNFGIGGIHGAEFNMELYLEDKAKAKAIDDRINWFRSKVSDAKVMETRTTIVIDGEKYKLSEFVTKKKDGTLAYKYAKPVQLFVQDKKSKTWNLNKRYAWCSDDEVDHEDFTSYYPCLLMNLQAYVNEALGEDRYVQQFENKGKYGKLMKDKSLSEAERDFYATLREGTKLILNSASGASDTTYDNNIRMNNVIITMRILGQLFTWRIGQAQTLEGFKITSTNTDGLYAVCDENTRPRCREILERESKSINVGIEPEEMRLISKDANNRIEISLDGKLLSASGGDTACHKGPMPTKALSHPALIDALMVRYLMKHGVNKPFDVIAAAEILDKMKEENDPHYMLTLYQQIINSSEGSCRYIFGVVGENEIRTFQHNNRIFAVKADAAHLYVANGNNISSGHDETADKVLQAYGVDISGYRCTRIMKFPRIDPAQNMMIYNRDLFELPDDTARGFIDNIDDGFYLSLLETTYNNWCNCPGAPKPEDGDEDEAEAS